MKEEFREDMPPEVREIIDKWYRIFIDTLNEKKNRSYNDNSFILTGNEFIGICVALTNTIASLYLSLYKGASKKLKLEGIDISEVEEIPSYLKEIFIKTIERVEEIIKKEKCND